MRLRQPPSAGSSRRGFLAGLAGVVAAADKGQSLPSERHRFLDPATEFELVRLTDPAYNCFLPQGSRAVSRRGDFLLYASDRTGSPQLFHLDIKPGASRQLTSVDGLDTTNFALLPGDRNGACVAGGALLTVSLGTLRERVVYRPADSGVRVTGMSVSSDGLLAALVETNGGGSLLRLIDLRTGSAKVLAEIDGILEDPQINPKRGVTAYRRGENEIWQVHHDGQGNRRIAEVPGRVRRLQWAPEGASILYLHLPAESRALHEMRETVPDARTDKRIAATSQFATFGVNGDASVFVGASASKPSPHVLLLLRLTQREFTLCEHRCSQPESTRPAFFPNSQAVLFQSDKEGKFALYAMAIERLVEKTETGETPEELPLPTSKTKNR